MRKFLTAAAILAASSTILGQTTVRGPITTAYKVAWEHVANTIADSQNVTPRVRVDQNTTPIDLAQPTCTLTGRQFDGKPESTCMTPVTQPLADVLNVAGIHTISLTLMAGGQESSSAPVVRVINPTCLLDGKEVSVGYAYGARSTYNTQQYANRYYQLVDGGFIMLAPIMVQYKDPSTPQGVDGGFRYMIGRCGGRVVG